jgi:hypothetical protein
MKKENGRDLLNLMIAMQEAAKELRGHSLGTVLGTVSSTMLAISRAKVSEETAAASVALLEAIESMCHASRFMREITIENEINELTNK